MLTSPFVSETRMSPLWFSMLTSPLVSRTSMSPRPAELTVTGVDIPETTISPRSLRIVTVDCRGTLTAMSTEMRPLLVSKPEG